MYHKGNVVKRDLKMATEWYEKSANQGYAEGEFKLSLMYLKGYGVEQNSQKFIELLSKSSGKGFLFSKIILAIIFEEGSIVEKNHEKAVSLIDEVLAEKFDLMKFFEMLKNVKKLTDDKNAKVRIDSEQILKEIDSLNINVFNLFNEF
jgi:hypothetical protein